MHGRFTLYDQTPGNVVNRSAHAEVTMFVDGSPFPQCHAAGCKILATCDPKWLHINCVFACCFTNILCDYGGEEVLQFGEDVADVLSGCRRRRLLWQCFKDMRYNNRMEFVVRLTGFMALAEVLVKGQSGLPWRAATSGGSKLLLEKAKGSFLLCDSFFFFWEL